MSQLLRIKCPSCGNVVDVAGNGTCANCGNPLVLPEDGVIQIYRMGSPFGIAVGMGIYLNGNPLGHLNEALPKNLLTSVTWKLASVNLYA